MTAMQELIEWMDREATRFESQDTVALHAGVRSYQLRTCINKATELLEKEKQQIERLRDIPMILAGGNTAEEKLAWATKEIKLLLKTKLKCNDKIMEQAAEIERLKGLIEKMYWKMFQHHLAVPGNFIQFKTENNL